MATSPWKKLPATWPADQTKVWVRRIYQMLPFQATIDYATQSFILDTGPTIPWWFIDSWRPL